MPALKKLRQGDLEVEASLSYMTQPCLLCEFTGYNEIGNALSSACLDIA